MIDNGCIPCPPSAAKLGATGLGGRKWASSLFLELGPRSALNSFNKYLLTVHQVLDTVPRAEELAVNETLRKGSEGHWLPGGGYF